MAKDLTNSRLDRQNILNNEIAIEELRPRINLQTVFWHDKYYATKNMIAEYFEVDIRTIERYISEYETELSANGYEVLKGKRLNDFIESYNQKFATDINVGRKIRSLTVFDFRAFLNIAMLLADSEKARALRQMMLDVVIDLINRKTGGGTKYINQKDTDFIFSAWQEDNYRRQFTDALKKCVEPNRMKYAHFTDMIYVSIFKEKAKEYKKILDLKASDKVRDTFYSEILDIISAYETGLADAIKKEQERKGHILSLRETEAIFRSFEEMALWKPLIQRGRTKMASRDMALREAFHYRLSEYIKPLDKEDFQKFLGVTGDELERLMAENQEVLKRLKERA
ncbi:MAG: DNA-binding protein [Schwartzia succinivorans]|nr:DNA-binding protein [Schwartzia succinivorans]